MTRGARSAARTSWSMTAVVTSPASRPPITATSPCARWERCARCARGPTPMRSTTMPVTAVTGATSPDADAGRRRWTNWSDCLPAGRSATGSYPPCVRSFDRPRWPSARGSPRTAGPRFRPCGGFGARGSTGVLPALRGPDRPLDSRDWRPRRDLADRLRGRPAARGLLAGAGGAGARHARLPCSRARSSSGRC